MLLPDFAFRDLGLIDVVVVWCLFVSPPVWMGLCIFEMLELDTWERGCGCGINVVFYGLFVVLLLGCVCCLLS